VKRLILHAGLVALGLIEVHVHLRDPRFSQKETIASIRRAAAADSISEQEHAP
jgi:dihydroorotase-like cyclic amidohydrolase